MKYNTSKEFTTLMDRTFFKFISLPILFFFVYYCYFNYNQGKGVLIEPELKVEWMFGYVGIWALPLYILFRKKQKIINLAGNQSKMSDKLNLIFEESKKYYWVLLLLFVISIVVFGFTNHPMMSFPVWLMIIVVSIEKPTIYRIGKMLRFRTKDQYMAFINDYEIEH